MSEAGTVPLEPRTSPQRRVGAAGGNTGTRSAPHPYQSGLRSDTVVLLGPPRVSGRDWGIGRAASPCSTVCLCLTAHPRPQFPHVSVWVYRGLGSLIGNPAGPGSLSGHGRPLCVSAQTMARPLSSPPGPALLLHHRGPRGFWAAGEGRLLQSPPRPPPTPPPHGLPGSPGRRKLASLQDAHNSGSGGERGAAAAAAAAAGGARTGCGRGEWRRRRCAESAPVAGPPPLPPLQAGPERVAGARRRHGWRARARGARRHK